MKLSNIFFIIFCCISNWCLAQTKTATILTTESFIEQIKLHHPIVKQANIIVEKSMADVLSRKGNFDPVLQFNSDNKSFDGKNYFYYSNPQIKIPTPIGVDLKTGVENNTGQYISSENTLGKSSYAGVEVALAKGMLIDKRRATLQQAKIFNNQSQQEKIKIINDILFDAYNSYWMWTGNYFLYKTYTQYLTNAKDRLRLTKIAFVNGERALTDTIEAYTQVQNFELLQNDAFIKLNNSIYNINNYLWLQNDSAYQLPINTMPDTIQFQINLPSVTNIDVFIEQNINNHPALRSYQYKIDALEIEKKLKFQNLLPELNLKYNILNKDYYVFKGINTNFLQNNFKWGIDFKIPIFLREGRGEYKKTKLKISESNLELKLKKWEIENKIKNYFTESFLLQQQLTTLQSAIKNYSFLLKAEQLRFMNGESSLFLINSRENKLLEILQKQIDIRVKYFKAKYALDWAAGILK